MNRTILSLCDKTGNMVRPWADAGFPCICVDLQHPAGETREGNITFIGVDLKTWIPPQRDYLIVFAFPPCTNLAVSGARWFKSKGLRALVEGLELVDRCRAICESIPAPYFIENPRSTISSYWRKPDFSFQPCDFGGYLAPPGDPYTKETFLWTGHGFELPPPRPVEPVDGSRMHKIPPGEDRANLRSVTPEGFARAVYEFNRPDRGQLVNRPPQEWPRARRYEPRRRTGGRRR